MSSAPLSAAASSSASRQQQHDNVRRSTSRSRDAASALSERRRRQASTTSSSSQQRSSTGSSRMKRNGIAISQGKAGRSTSENRGRRPMVAEANGNVSTPGMNGHDNRRQQGSGQSDNPFAFAPLPSTSPATRSDAKSNCRSHRSRSRSSSGQVSSSTTRTTPTSSMAGNNVPGSSTRTPNQEQNARRQQPQSLGRQPAQPQEQLIRGILHKRRDHLTYGFSAAWRPRLFILDKTRRRLNYYLLTNTSASSGAIGGDISGSVPTTPVGVNSRQNHTNIDGDDTPPPRSTLQTPQTVQTPAAMDFASPRQMDVTDTRSYDVTPRGMISLRGCVVRAVHDLRTPPALARSRDGSGSSSRANDRGGEDNQLFGLVISPQSRHQDLKNDVHLAATTRSDRDLWVRHLAEACGMVISPVPGGLVRSVPEPGRVVADTAGGSTTAQAEEEEEEEDGDNVGSDNGGGNSVSADADEAASRNSSSEEEEEQASDKEDETPPRPTIPAAATPTIATTSPLRTTSRRIFDTPAAVVAESEAGSSHTSRSTAAMPSRTGSTRTSGIRRQQPVSDINTIQSTKAPPSRFHPPLFHTAAILLAPPIVLRFARLIAPLALLAGALPQLFMFLFLARWSIRTVVQQYYLGRPITSRGGSLHGPVTCRIAVDLRGVLRFIGNKREERTPARLNGSSSSSSNHPVDTTTSHVSVTHIVAKAVATALSEVTPELNCRRVAIPLLGLGGWYTNDAVNVSIVSSSTQHVSTIEEADSLTVQQIADKVWRRQREQRPSNATNNETERVDLESFADNVSLSLVKTFLASLRPLSSQGTSTRSSCMIFTSPDSENSEVDIEVAPPCSQNEGDPSIIVVVGGVRVVDRDPRNISSEQSRRPMLSIAITIDCPVCSVTACRKFSERIQTLVQFPEMCEQTY